MSDLKLAAEVIAKDLLDALIPLANTILSEVVRVATSVALNVSLGPIWKGIKGVLQRGGQRQLDVLTVNFHFFGNYYVLAEEDSRKLHESSAFLHLEGWNPAHSSKLEELLQAKVTKMLKDPKVLRQHLLGCYGLNIRRYVQSFWMNRAKTPQHGLHFVILL
jgi:hypothetical protein